MAYITQVAQKVGSFLKEIAGFYFTPGIRSVGTILYLAVFAFCAVYYIDNIFLALKFLAYVVTGNTALSSISYLFVGMVFIISLVLPFSISIYSISVLPKIWNKEAWSTTIKWIVTGIVIVGVIATIIVSHATARTAARHSTMTSFVEDAGIGGRI